LRCPEEANLKAPEAVVKVHLGFIRAGAELIEANTFGANRRKLSAQLLDDRLDEIVETGVKLAREARDVSGSPVLVAGSLGPLGDLEGSHGAENAYDVFHEQARLLEGRGVDLFMVETFFDLEELETAIAAVKDASSLPIVAQLTFDEDAETLAGVSAGEAVVRLRGLGVVAIGANCGVGPQAALAALSEMSSRSNGVALSAQPNVGLPSRSGASSIRTRRRTTSPSSRRRRAISARGSSAAAAVRLRPRSRRSEQRSRRRANRAWRCSSSSAK
jgi:methionine synthase / methylenetetrahydrofolate reductase(NADPH)